MLTRRRTVGNGGFGLLVLFGVDFGVAVAEVESLLAVGRLDALYVGERVPSPVAHGTEGDAFLVVVEVGLHASDVHGGGEVAIADGQRCQRVSSSNYRVVAKKNSLAVNRGCYVFCRITEHFHFQ